MIPHAPSPLTSLLPVVAIFAIFYFLVIRPQQQEQKKHEQMLAALRKGDRVLTTGGVYGVITSLRGADLELKVADNVKLLVARSAVAKLAPVEQAAEATPVAS